MTRYPDSMLEAMFNGSIPTTKDDRDGSCFINRNGRLFEYVVDFLRSAKRSLISDLKDLKVLAIEAEFYQSKR